MDRASGVPKSYRALVDHDEVSRSTLHRAHGRRSIESRAFLVGIREVHNFHTITFFQSMRSFGVLPIRTFRRLWVSLGDTRRVNFRESADEGGKPPLTIT